MEKEELLKIENQLCFKIYSVSRGITRAYRPMLEKLSLTYPQYLVMLFLWENGDSKMKDISKTLFLDSGTLTPVIKNLEKTGYIKKERDKNDESPAWSLSEREASELDFLFSFSLRNMMRFFPD